MQQRACFVCGTPINSCFGYVLAGDFIQALNGLLEWTKVRELCGKCVEKYEWEKSAGNMKGKKVQEKG
ncbi:MAG: hypothetical protein A3C80_01235 [Candidatus Ryanbacteria bacterium RIFCSPHIGHO2_02_FULL_45_43]|uniref:Uncharacterized protein n=1 Tax=Candidatus Ryanbacteria bacterium RIFCSPHIGHO2_01_45_13 TaxID=1802112 RepID=A0A1G2FZ18_9BACT|nr:MAG: hypothetical protein A2718_03465 [Candidatus Ryanbacteria bacterium RIFCSPHIGHO2_01_FULL_44_130]OGZ42858.1 MAG: hypothetical protein A2W41_01910 [Candidatus Ryanbacteria bacterium RIFCSPHIGHO2_01_45_13]OGZ48148.1 MAG: hypothetical protein A3C80_01235 [Candidatus Ryanbacteria bacterium RIFCSPHIGHO2_02_FULL_45_43]OGZ49795.1 MAG: hypothetical protein A3E55_01060 [Candidatus Ryanbacteria bacterium RIFCSPHIGHO2_12_FULL_44_20]OGZ51222.1 MAG: hypothetical protein A3A17_04270 [Candidatus Ryanba